MEKRKQGILAVDSLNSDSLQLEVHVIGSGLIMKADTFIDENWPSNKAYNPVYDIRTSHLLVERELIGLRP